MRHQPEPAARPPTHGSSAPHVAPNGVGRRRLLQGAVLATAGVATAALAASVPTTAAAVERMQDANAEPNRAAPVPAPQRQSPSFPLLVRIGG